MLNRSSRDECSACRSRNWSIAYRRRDRDGVADSARDATLLPRAAACGGAQTHRREHVAPGHTSPVRRRVVAVGRAARDRPWAARLDPLLADGAEPRAWVPARGTPAQERSTSRNRTRSRHARPDPLPARRSTRRVPAAPEQRPRTQSVRSRTPSSRPTPGGSWRAVHRIRCSRGTTPPGGR